MTNHVHLLITPVSAGEVSWTLRRSVDDMLLRQRSLRDEREPCGKCRFKSCLVDSETYLLRCYRYIELNPVRAGIVAHAKEYRWSSFASNGGGGTDALVHPHPAYTALGTNPHERQVAYRALVEDAVDAEEMATIRTFLRRQHALGSDRFRDQIEAMLQRRVGPAKIGRPRKRAESPH